MAISVDERHSGSLENTKNVFGRGSVPNPVAVAYDAPRPLVGWEGDTPASFPSPLDTFDVSLSTPLALRRRILGAQTSLA